MKFGIAFELPCRRIIRILVVMRLISHAQQEAAPRAKVALALQGGGFRAHVADVGIIAGLLKFVGELSMLPLPTLRQTGLLDRFDTFSTNSGSTWFFSELAYSSSFRSLIEQMAASPRTAGDQFNAQWFDPWKRASGVDPNIFNPRRDVAEWLVTLFLGKGDEDTIFAMQYILATNASWNEFVKILLTSTSSIERDMTLASPVEDWAVGKYWLVDHTILLPSEHDRAFMFTKDMNLSKYDFYQTVRYGAKGKGSVSPLVPAKFSIKLGDGPNASAPFPYLARSAVVNLTKFDYKGIVFPLVDAPKRESANLDYEDLSGKALVRNVGSLPIWGVATASSAFAGGASMFGLLVNKVLARLNHADLTPWVSNAADGAAFSRASALVAAMKEPFGVRRGTVKEAALGAVHGVVDGGYSDGTGLGTAISAGAREVLLILNSGPTDSPFYLEVLCTDGPRPANPMLPQALFPLFETSASAVQKAWSGFDRLRLPNGTRFLTMLSAGSIQMTTADNRYFGIERGHHVIVHVVTVCASLNIGFFEKYVNFGQLSQEIILTILSDYNKGIVNDVVLPMLLGQSSSGRSATVII